MKFLYIAEPIMHPSAYYRAVMPYVALHELAQEVVVDVDASMMANGRIGKLIRGQVYDPDVVVLRRMVNDERDLIESARKNGQLVYMDIDDDMWNVPEWNPVRHQLNDQILAAMVAQMRICDGVFTTTPELKQQLRGVGVDVPIHVTVNAMQMEVYNQERNDKEHTPFRLAWMGATNYRWADLEMIVEPLMRALDGRADDVEFWHYGAHPDLPSLTDLLPSDFPVRIEALDWTVPSMVARELGKIDALLIPQIECRFAMCRSATTGIAACASGVPFVATQTPAYARLWHRGAGYPATTPDEWEAAIRVMVDDEYRETRRGMRMSGYAVARENTVETLAKQLTEVFLWPKVSAKSSH